MMTNKEIELKNEDEVYDFELFFLNNIYDSLQEISDDLDCLIDGYDEFEQEIYGDFRTVIINLAISFELIVKFRLENEHWSLIFADINKAKRSKLENGDFISVDIESGVLRLKNICELNYDFKNLRKICNFRNCLIHFTLRRVNIIEVINTISNGILELKQFFENEIYECLPEEAKKDFKSVLESLKNHCEDLNVLSMKIIKKGSVENE